MESKVILLFWKIYMPTASDDVDVSGSYVHAHLGCGAKSREMRKIDNRIEPTRIQIIQYDVHGCEFVRAHSARMTRCCHRPLPHGK